jgi:hypothetical protein
MKPLAFLTLMLANPLAAADLSLPPLGSLGPTPGKRAVVTTPEYAGTQVRHLVALPDDWTPDWRARGKTWPVIAEYTGNYFPTSGSTGEVEGAALGFGLARGRAIWVVLPYVAKGRTKNERTWWGDVDATVGYAKTNIPRICAEFGGDPKKVVLCGFSRGAIGVSFLGLHDDEVAGLWCGLWAHDHFDGMLEWKGHAWGSPLARYRAEAAARLRRLAGRPLLVTQAGAETKKFIASVAPTNVDYLNVDMAAHFGDFPNDFVKHPHNDRWPLRDGPATEAARAWFTRVTTAGQPAK